jgi:amino acid transporter
MMVKGLRFIDVFCIAAGAIISSGIFVLPGLAYAHVGPAVILFYLIAGLLAMVGVLSVVDLATAMPKAGGDYYFVTRSLGPADRHDCRFVELVRSVLENGFCRIRSI